MKFWPLFFLVLILGMGTGWAQDSATVTVKTGKASSHTHKKKKTKKTSKKPKKSTKKTKKTKTKKKKVETDPQVETEITRQAVTIDLQGK